MRFIDILRRSARSLRSAKTRTLLTSFAIAVGTFALTLTLAASNGAQHYANDIVNSNFDPSELIVTKDASVLSTANSTSPQEYDASFSTIANRTGSTEQVKELTDDDLARLKTTSGVSSVRTQSVVSAQYITRPGLRKYVATIQAQSPSQQLDLLAGSVRNPLAQGTVVLPEGYLSDLGFANAQAAIGKTVSITVQQATTITAATISSYLNGSANATPASKVVTFKIVAVSKPPALAQQATSLYLYASQRDATALQDYTTQGTSSYHHYLYAYVKVTDGTDTKKLEAVQAKLKSLGYGAQSVADTEQFLTQLISVLQGIVLAFGLISVVASVFGIVNTMYISVLQRTREIGLMKALGMSQRSISSLFRIEAALIGFVGGVIGSLLALLVGVVLNPFITKTLSLGKDKLLMFEPLQIILLIIGLMIVATLAGLLPARRAAKLDPIAALRVE